MINIIIPIYNRKEFTRKCLFSLYQQTYKEFKVIVVDDGSTDNSEDMIKNNFPEVIILKGNGNLWWTGGVNLGINYILDSCNNDDYVLLLNNDLILDTDYFDRLLEIIDYFPNFIIGSVEVLTTNSKEIKSGGVVVNKFKAKMFTLNQGKNIDQYPKDHFEKVSTLTGRGTLYPISVFREVGLFDQKHFPHYGDFELPYRAGKKGYKKIVHYSLVVNSFPDEINSDVLIKKSKYKLGDFKKYFFNKYSNANIISRWYLSKSINKSSFGAIYFYLINIIRNAMRFILNLDLKG
ncbi:MAG: glycosyltransferase family 2 protein [Melioribacteraceae bacterium]|nr:glycosyltransferase family 2 protein [Melioribacteraceae bacterium]MCF8394764.1 glycosyltransferase family 2 protein [Melioribacteraceae bacterium]